MQGGSVTRQTYGAVQGQAAVFMAIVVATVGQTFVFSVLPPIGRKIGIPDVLVALISAGSALSYTIAAPALGGMTESLGRKPFIMFGLMSGVVLNALFGFAIELNFDGVLGNPPTYALLILLRLSLSLSWAGMFPAAQAYVADTSTPERRTAAFALVGAAFSLGMVCGPAIGSVFSTFGLVAPFYFAAGLHLLGLVFALASVSESAPSRAHGVEQMVLSSSSHVQIGSVRRLLLIAVLFAGCSSLVQQLVGFRLQDIFSVPPEQAAKWAGILLAVMAGAMLFAQFVARLWMRSAREAMEATLWMLVAGSGIGALAVALMAGSPAAAFWFQAVAMAVFGLGLGLLIPSVGGAISLSAGHKAQGRAAGLFSSAQGIGFVIGPTLGTGLYGWGHTGPFWLASALLMAVSAIALGMIIDAPKVKATSAS